MSLQSLQTELHNARRTRERMTEGVDYVGRRLYGAQDLARVLLDALTDIGQARVKWIARAPGSRYLPATVIQRSLIGPSAEDRLKKGESLVAPTERINDIRSLRQIVDWSHKELGDMTTEEVPVGFTGLMQVPKIDHYGDGKDILMLGTAPKDLPGDPGTADALRGESVLLRRAFAWGDRDAMGEKSVPLIFAVLEVDSPEYRLPDDVATAVGQLIPSSGLLQPIGVVYQPHGQRNAIPR